LKLLIHLQILSLAHWANVENIPKWLVWAIIGFTGKSVNEQGVSRPVISKVTVHGLQPEKRGLAGCKL
jgi:hypothetical protein